MLFAARSAGGLGRTHALRPPRGGTGELRWDVLASYKYNNIIRVRGVLCCDAGDNVNKASSTHRRIVIKYINETIKKKKNIPKNRRLLQG